MKNSKKSVKKKQAKKPTFTVKLDGELHIQLESWLMQPETRSMGYHSKSDFVNQAVREMLKRERGPRFTDLVENSDGDYVMVDTYLVTSENNILVTIDRTHKTMMCTHCKLSTCDHILYIWASQASSSRLSNIGFPCSVKYKRYDHHV